MQDNKNIINEKIMDISKCKGRDCPIRDKSYRYLADESEYQSFVIDPYKIKDGVFSCDLFWGKQSESILEQLKNIMK